jgi:hypothetical protein
MRNLALGQGPLEFFHAGLGDPCAEAEQLPECRQFPQMVQGRIADPGPRQAHKAEVLHSLQRGNAGIIDLSIGEEQFPQSRQVLEMHQPRTRDPRSGQVKFLKVYKPSEMYQIAIGDPALAQMDADDSLLLVKGDPGAKFLEVVQLLGEGRIGLDGLGIATIILVPEGLRLSGEEGEGQKEQEEDRSAAHGCLQKVGWVLLPCYSRCVGLTSPERERRAGQELSCPGHGHQRESTLS